MRGHLQQRGNEGWRIKVYVGRSATAASATWSGRCVDQAGGRAGSWPALVVEVDEGTYGELLDRWLTVKAQSVEPKTLDSYARVARMYLRPALADRRLASLRAIDLDGLYAELSASGLSPRTVRICHTVARQSLEQAREWVLIARSPAVDAMTTRCCSSAPSQSVSSSLRRSVILSMPNNGEFNRSRMVVQG